ncbi:hypothetical protein AMTRI_Chr06g192500 [Amborella trichopoda]
MNMKTKRIFESKIVLATQLVNPKIPFNWHMQTLLCTCKHTCERGERVRELIEQNISWRLLIKFEEGVFGTPQLTDSIEIPENVEVLGQTIELSPFREFITPLQDAATSVARSISGSTPFKFLITIDRAESWLLTTFLDEDLCISRGDASSVFVLIKEGSSLLPPTL